MFFVLYLVVYFPMCSSSLQCFDAVGSVFWPVKGKDNPFRKPVSEMTYTVSGGTLNHSQPTKAQMYRGHVMHCNLLFLFVFCADPLHEYS